MDEANVLLEARRLAGLSQRSLAARAGTSQSAIARYESGVTAPSLATLERLLVACGRQLRLVHEPTVDEHDVELALEVLDLEPAARLQALANWSRLRSTRAS
ncbi:MAG: helix-turn-helix transcriptional regulator [Nitriliruptorales bacterium]|nr:helix-turn-helix transcriptional regulator [Nitriliruptorales bacterium]